MADSRFHALAAGDFNGDETSDLAVGAWANDVGGSNGQGSVTVYFGSSKGLKRSTHQFFTLETPGVPGSSVAPPRGAAAPCSDGPWRRGISAPRPRTTWRYGDGFGTAVTA
ncbi:MAG TPA: FG-GAP repeat protein [Actinomycetota bacterium]|nr:FG-GAP repeat protein [Actinomycetota bacterium]